MMEAFPVAVVLAAGRGTRLGSLTSDGRPKPLLPVGDRPLIDRIIDDLHRAGVSRVLVNAYHGASELIEYSQDGRRPLPVEVRQEKALRGPAGSLLTFSDVLARTRAFLVVSGDALIDVDYRELLRVHDRVGGSLTIVAKPVEDAQAFDVLDVDARGRIIAFRQRPHGFRRGLVSCGVYAVAPEVLALLPPDALSDYADVYRSLTASGQTAHAFPYDGNWCDIGSPRAPRVGLRVRSRWVGSSSAWSCGNR
jgi:NDP-sugar pyrophosphorylase family protein